MKFLKLFIVLLVAFSISCEKAEECPRDFLMYGAVSPYQVKYTIGDTIELMIDVEKDVLEKELSKYYDLSSVKMQCLFMIYDLNNTNDILYKVTDYVDGIKEDTLYNQYLHNFSSGSQIVFSSLLYNDGRFKNKIRFIPKDTGLFMLTYGAFLMEDKQYFQGKCNRVDTYLSTRLNKDKDNNIELLNESPNQKFANSMRNPPENFYETKSGFAYRVVE